MDLEFSTSVLPLGDAQGVNHLDLKFKSENYL